MNLEEMDIHDIANVFLSNKCGACEGCSLRDLVRIRGKDVTFCYLIYTIVKEDRKKRNE